MKTGGIIRRVDDLGRIVIPREFRAKLGIKYGDPMEIFTENKRILLRKYKPEEDLISLVNELEEAFFDLKNDMPYEVAKKIYSHIEDIHKILDGKGGE